MEDFNEILVQVKISANKKRLFLVHALLQMSRPDRLITTTEVRKVIENGKVIEDYPDDPRGHSCLMLGYGENGRPIHDVCSPKDDYFAVVTAYLPNEIEWENDYETRRNL